MKKSSLCPCRRLIFGNSRKKAHESARNLPDSCRRAAGSARSHFVPPFFGIVCLTVSQSVQSACGSHLHDSPFIGEAGSARSHFAPPFLSLVCVTVSRSVQSACGSHLQDSPFIGEAGSTRSHFAPPFLSFVCVTVSRSVQSACGSHLHDSPFIGDQHRLEHDSFCAACRIKRIRTHVYCEFYV